MDINDFRSAFTVIMLVLFVGIWIWAWQPQRKKDFDQAANLPFEHEDKPASSQSKES